jgi:hypothetical protein
MTDATVVLNGTTLGTHQGGSNHLRKGANVLAVIVDGRWLDVPPNALPGGANTIDYLQNHSFDFCPRRSWTTPQLPATMAPSPFGDQLPAIHYEYLVG